MNDLNLSRCALSVCVAAIFLTSCGGSQLPAAQSVSFQPGAGLASLLAQPSWTITQIALGFNAPQGVAVDTAGNVYVADTGNNMVKKVAPNGKITQIGSGFSTPMGVAVHNGAVYVADTGHNAVKKVAPVGPITKVGSGFKTPVGVAVGKYGYVYVNDLGNHAVKKVAPDGEITEIVWRGLCFGATYVSGVAVDAIANVYVSVNCTHFYGGLHSATVFKIRPNGQTTTLFSQGDWINGVAVVKPGGLYYSQGSNGSRFVPSAVYYKTLGKRTKVGSGFSAPMGLALHNGAVYVADTGNNAVEKVTP